jgi:N-acylglucosamine 2-epimerase
MEQLGMVHKSSRMTFEELKNFLENHLLQDVVPFWMKYGLDKENGGLFSCINDEGVIQSRDKFIWSQARGLWTFSALYNRIKTRKEWLDVADGLFQFLKDHGRNSQGYWIFRTDEKGKMLQDAESIVTDAFAILGLVEYAKATDNKEAIDIAIETYHTVCERLSKPGSYSTAPYPTPSGMKAHRERMQFSLAFCELGTLSKNAEIAAHGLAMGREVIDHFTRWEREVLLEYLNCDNTAPDTPEGRAMVPGHGIESCYFQIMNFSGTKDSDYALRACEPIRWALEKGWDKEYGGLFLGIDADGKTPVYWKYADMKLWWPHAEALAGCLLAYEQCGEQWCLDWYWKLHDWSFSHFPVKDYGEWTQRLDRTGRHKIDTVVALPVKDPFHLQRGLIFAIESLRRLPKRKKCAKR